MLSSLYKDVPSLLATEVNTSSAPSPVASNPRLTVAFSTLFEIFSVNGLNKASSSVLPPNLIPPPSFSNKTSAPADTKALPPACSKVAPSLKAVSASPPKLVTPVVRYQGTPKYCKPAVPANCPADCTSESVLLPRTELSSFLSFNILSAHIKG